MDIILEVLKRLVSEVKQEIGESTFLGLLIALTFAVLVSLIVPVWILGLALLVGWGLIIKDIYDEFLEWATDAPAVEPEEEQTDDKEIVDTDDKK